MTTSTKTIDTYPTLTVAQAGRDSLWRIHTSTDPTVIGLLKRLPGYVETRQAIRAIWERQPPTVTLVRAIDEVREALIESALAGVVCDSAELVARFPSIGAVPAYEGRGHNVAVPIVTNARDYLVASVEAEALHQARQALSGRLDAILNSNIAKILAGITEQLEDLVEAARKVLTGRGRIVDAEDAIAQDRIEEWKHSESLAADYANLRSLQTFWMGHGGSLTSFTGNGDQFVGYVRNPDDMPDFSRVITRKKYRAPEDEKAFQRDFRAGRVRDRGLWPANWTTPEAIWWFAENRQIRPWAPTDHQVSALLDRLSATHLAHDRGASRPARPSEPSSAERVSDTQEEK